MKLLTVAIFFVITSVPLYSFPAQVNDSSDDKWATVRGQIIFGGDEVPGGDVVTPRDGGPAILVTRWVVNEKNKGVKNVLVWLAADEKDRGIRIPEKLIHPDLRKPAPTVEVSIKEMHFFPPIMGMRGGQKLVFKNTLNEATNIRYQSEALTGNVLVPPTKEHTIEEIKAEAVPLGLSSNVHHWMQSWVRVYEHPYFAVTDEDGHFEIRLAPVGDMRIYLWHPDSGFRDGAKGKTGHPIHIKHRGLDLGTISIKPAK